MQTEFRISTRVGVEPSQLLDPHPPSILQVLGLLTDSKSLSGFAGAYVSSPNDSIPSNFIFGRERAFTEAPGTFRVLRKEDARRKL
jgi:hypothetical protein